VRTSLTAAITAAAQGVKVIVPKQWINLVLLYIYDDRVKTLAAGRVPLATLIKRRRSIFETGREKGFNLERCMDILRSMSPNWRQYSHALPPSRCAFLLSRWAQRHTRSRVELGLAQPSNTRPHFRLRQWLF
jgi:hypothetical protein